MSQFKESNLQQQLELVTREKEWLTKELATQQAEFAEYRTTKLAAVTRLQTELDTQTEAARAAREAADRTAAELAALRQTHEQTAAQLAKVQDELAVSREQFLREMDAQKRVVAGYEGLVKDTKAQAEQAEGAWLARVRTALAAGELSEQQRRALASRTRPAEAAQQLRRRVQALTTELQEHHTTVRWDEHVPLRALAAVANARQLAAGCVDARRPGCGGAGGAPPGAGRQGRGDRVAHPRAGAGEPAAAARPRGWRGGSDARAVRDGRTRGRAAAAVWAPPHRHCAWRARTLTGGACAHG